MGTVIDFGTRPPVDLGAALAAAHRLHARPDDTRARMRLRDAVDETWRAARRREDIRIATAALRLRWLVDAEAVPRARFLDVAAELPGLVVAAAA